MPTIEKNQEQYNDLSTLESKASNLTPDQKKEVGTNVDVEKALLDWRDTGAYKVLPPSYEEFVQDLKKVDYTPDNKYIQQIKAYVFAKEKVSGDLIKACKQSQNDIIVLGSKSIPLQSIYGALSKSAILAYKQSNTGGIAKSNQLPENVSLGDMKLIDALNNTIKAPSYLNMMQYIQRCKDEDRLIQSTYLQNPNKFYKELQDQIGFKKENASMEYPILTLFNTLLGNKLSVGKIDVGRYRESTTQYIVPSIDSKTFMPVGNLTWHNISSSMQAYIRPILENLFPYHTYNVDVNGTIRMVVQPQDVYQKLKNDRDTRYKNRLEESGVGANNTYPVLEANFDLLSTDRREAISDCLTNIDHIPGDVFAVQQEHNNKVLKEMSAPSKNIPDPFGRMSSSDVKNTKEVYAADDIKHWRNGEGSSNKLLATLYNDMQAAERYGKLVRFEPSDSGYKLVVYYTGYSLDGKAKEVNFLNRRIDKSGVHI